MSIKSIIIGSIFIFTMYLLLVSSAVKWANEVSKKTEQNFADAVRVMQGD